MKNEILIASLLISLFLVSGCTSSGDDYELTPEQELCSDELGICYQKCIRLYDLSNEISLVQHQNCIDDCDWTYWRCWGKDDEEIRELLYG